MLKKLTILIIMFVVSVVFVYSDSSSPSGTASPFPPRTLLQVKPFVIYFETFQDAPMVTQTIKKDFPDALIEITSTTVGKKALVVAKIYIPSAQRAAFSAYLSSTSTAIAGELQSSYA